MATREGPRGRHLDMASPVTYDVGAREHDVPLGETDLNFAEA